MPAEEDGRGDIAHFVTDGLANCIQDDCRKERIVREVFYLPENIRRESLTVALDLDYRDAHVGGQPTLWGLQISLETEWECRGISTRRGQGKGDSDGLYEVYEGDIRFPTI